MKEHKKPQQNPSNPNPNRWQQPTQHPQQNPQHKPQPFPGQPKKWQGN